MKAPLNLFGIFFFAISSIYAQTQTYQINWTFGVNGEAASRTIEEGDTVEWVWGDPDFHTVTNKPGSIETFDSGNLNGLGTIFSHTFSSIGSNDYQCNLHALSMYGTITVVAEGTLSNEDFYKQNFSIFPNPATTRIILKLPKTIASKTIAIYNLLGQEVYLSKENENSLDISFLNKGMYFLKIKSEDLIHTKQFIKF